ncbi:PREDICTED: tetratricopeptide repeat protein 40, partial [Mesitornis unicolor]|uniref:tetratricopeptide repeat protein 40 n=1 Tax=Mesitornis unicolor TaxID=54374 RepID=UPI00052942BB
VQALKNAYEMIKSASQGKSALDSSDNFSTDLYVLCAEQALQLGYLEMSSDCLQMYFKGRFPVSQFLGRAYLCQGQLHTPLSTGNLEDFEKFVLFFMKAVDFATHDPRYYFLLYNASVLYWQLVRPYLQPGFRCCLIPSLSHIVEALNQAEEQDKEWRAELMINLLECFLDGSKLKEAEEFSPTAAAFIKENVPDKYSEIFSLMVYYKLMDISQVEKEIKSSIHLSVIYKMQMLKLQWDTDEFPSDATTSLNSIYVLLKQYDVPPASVLRVKIPLILELARFSMKVNCIKVAHDCILDLKRAGITEQGKLIEIECLEYEYEIKKIGTKVVTYTKGVVEAQLELIKKLEVTLERAVQLGDPDVIQVVCATQWNLCLPLLQHNLHQRVRRPLMAVADVLEEVDSMLILLRCQVHMEIARIEEDGDRIEAAMKHLQKAVHLNNGGPYQEHLRVSLNRLRVYAMLHKSPEHPEDWAGMMIEQAKKGKQKDTTRKNRSLLVNAGLALAPDSFKIVLDSENEAKVSPGKSRSQISHLCAKAHHHMKSVEQAEQHLKRLRNANDRERILLWADLAKVARKQEAWDVCRAACRFCLLYDDALFRKVTKPEKTKKKASTAAMGDDHGDSSRGESLLPAKSFSFERDLLRILAEIRFITAEATVHLLRLQGIELNDGPVPPDTSQHRPGCDPQPPESDPEWKTYSLWIDGLSQYAMENFQRAAEIGEELNEAWMVHNTVVYVLNYNRHLISSGRQRGIISYLQTLLGAIRAVGHDGSTAILLMLCDALARGLILCWIPKTELAEKETRDAARDRNRRASMKKQEKANVIQPLSVDPSGLPDIKAALEICEFALNVATGTAPHEAAPLAAQQRVIATWVKAKQLHQQQTGHRLRTEEENDGETRNPAASILIGLEMYSCSGLGLMDFTVPSLSQLVKLALECRWSDSLVELQTLTRLTYFAYVSHDHDTVMTCSKRILRSDEHFFHSRDSKKYEMPGNRVRQEMLSTTACIQGKSIMENLSGRKHLRVAASKAFVQSVRYAGEAGNYSLVMFAARHFWNTCLHLLSSPRDREQLKEPTEVILRNIIKAESKNKQEKNDTVPLHQWITKDFQNIGFSVGCFLPGAEEDLTLRTSLYGLLFHINADKADWETALKVLDEAIRVLPHTRHRLLIFKHMVTVNAELGHSFAMEIQKFRDEGEDYLSRMWCHLVTVSRSVVGQLSCFQSAITALQKQENEWQKVDYLMEFAEWLYCNQFPLSEVIKPLDWAVDLLLQMEVSLESSQGEDKNTVPKFSPTENSKINIGANGTIPQINLEYLSNIKQLEALFRAQTLMAFISGHGSCFHQQHCLVAYACVIRIWQVSLSASGPIAKALSKSSQPTVPQKVQSTITLKKEKGKKKEKQVEVSVVKETPKGKGPVDTLPANVEEWAHYDCPTEIREAFKQKTNSYGINWDNFPKPTHTLYFMDLLSEELQKMFCPHLIIPIFQLAEVIANEIVECRSLSNLYHLRIALICSDLKLSQASLYHEKAAGEAYISELEQAMCRQEIALKKEKQILTGKGLSALSFPYLWIEKAEVLIQLGLYQPARLLLSEAHAATQALQAPGAVSRCLQLLAVLARREGGPAQAAALLERAQRLGGSEKLWYRSALGLAEAALEGGGKGRHSTACGVLEHAVSVLRSSLLRTPNREAELGFMITSLEARKTLIEIRFAHDCTAGSAEPCQLPEMLQESYNKLVQIEKDFINYGHKNCSAEILLERANIHRMIAKQDRSKEGKHGHYLEAYNLAQRAVSRTEEVFHNVRRLISVNETTNISIPLMRQLANRKINLVEILLDIFSLLVAEKKPQVGEASSRKIVEAFIRGAIEDKATQQDWKHVGRSAGHAALAQLVNMQRLCPGCPDIKSKCLYLTGKTLHLLAISVDPVCSEVYWKPNVVEEAKSNIAKTSLASAECSEEEATDSSLWADKCRHKYGRTIQELKKEHRLAQYYLSQCSEALVQCMGIAFAHQITDVLAPASFEMVECFQQLDPVSASQFLALHQSCSASMAMKSVLLAATSNTSSSQLAALLHLQRNLKQSRGTSDLLKSVEQQLAATSVAWRNLCIPVEHFSIMDELPSNFHIIILQHSEDRSGLFSSWVEVPRASPAPLKGKPTWPTVQAKASRFPVNPDTFCALLEKVRLFKQQQMKRCLEQTVVRHLQECVSKADVLLSVETLIIADGRSVDHCLLSKAFAVMADCGDCCSCTGKEKGGVGFPEDRGSKRRTSVVSDFTGVAAVLTLCFLCKLEPSSVSVLVMFSLIPLPRKQSTSAAESGRMKVNEKDGKHAGAQGTPMDLGLCVVLLADPLLMELPLEALSIFRAGGISSVSRDFSLQILYNRIHLAAS